MSHPSNTVVLRGHLSSAPREKQLPSGDDLISYEVTTDLGEERASVPVVWFSPRRAPTLEAGDEVVVVGFVRRRFYRFAGGSSSRTEVVASVVARPSTRTAVRAVARACGLLPRSADGVQEHVGGVHH